jgi:hypothetical protein
MNEAFYLNTLERVFEAVKGSSTDEQRIATLHALADVTGSMLLAISGGKYDEERISEIHRRIVDVNTKPSIIRKIDNGDDFFIQTYTKLTETLLFTNDDELYITLCAFASLMAKILIGYKTKDILADEERIFNIVNRLLNVSID